MSTDYCLLADAERRYAVLNVCVPLVCRCPYTTGRQGCGPTMLDSEDAASEAVENKLWLFWLTQPVLIPYSTPQKPIQSFCN